MFSRERIKLGKTANGAQYIEPDCVETLCGMGYDRQLAISALKHSNNHMTQAVHLLQEQPHLLEVKRKCIRISPDDIVQVCIQVGLVFIPLGKFDIFLNASYFF